MGYWNPTWIIYGFFLPPQKTREDLRKTSPPKAGPSHQGEVIFSDDHRSQVQKIEIINSSVATIIANYSNYSSNYNNYG